MTPDLKAKIHRDLEVATQGEWWANDLSDSSKRAWDVCAATYPRKGVRKEEEVAYLDCESPEADARHIANCSPENVRALLEENAALERAGRAYKLASLSANRKRDAARAKVAALEAEVERLESMLTHGLDHEDLVVDRGELGLEQ